jgi:hypothetical protein
LLSLVSATVSISFSIASSVSAIAGICYPWLAKILHLLFPVAAGKALHLETKGMLLALPALRMLVLVLLDQLSRQTIERKVCLMFLRKLYLMEMEKRLILLTWVRTMLITPIILLRREHLDPLVEERE